MTPLKSAQYCAMAALTLLPFHSALAVDLLNTTIDGEQTKVTLGGYAKVDVRHVSGDIAYQDYWVQRQRIAH